jgi:hypothetical protein
VGKNEIEKIGQSESGRSEKTIHSGRMQGLYLQRHESPGGFLRRQPAVQVHERFRHLQALAQGETEGLLCVKGNSGEL